MVTRAIVLTEPPSIDALEVTEKGSVNQKAVLANRSTLVEDLYADNPVHRVIDVASSRAPASRGSFPR